MYEQGNKFLQIVPNNRNNFTFSNKDKFNFV